MQLILAIDSDPRRSEQLASLVHDRMQVDLVQATSAGEGLHALKDRVPDLILTSPLLSPFDDGVLDEYLRDLGAAGAHVQTVRIPVLSAPPKKKGLANTLLALRRTQPTSAAAPDGCDPTVFADEIAVYLSRAADARQSVAHLSHALSPRQDEAPPSRVVTAPVAHSTVMTQMSPSIIEEFADAVEAPQVEVAEERYALPAVPSYDVVSMPPRVERTEAWIVDELQVDATESSPADQAVATGTPIVDRLSEAEQTTPHEPTGKGTSATFEAALAAIRAAWVKPPEGPVTIRSSSTPAAPPRASEPGIAAPPASQEVARQTRPENRHSEMKASEPRPKQDEWGIFDPDQCGFSAVVDELDKVAESKDAPPRSVTRTVISIR
jgi:hypothetical protein